MISQVGSVVLRGEDCESSSSSRRAVRPREIRICDVSRNFSEDNDARFAVWLDRMLDLLLRRRRGGSTEDERLGDTEGEESAGQCVRPRAIGWKPRRVYDIFGVGGDAVDITSESRVLVVADGGWKDEDVWDTDVVGLLGEPSWSSEKYAGRLPLLLRERLLIVLCVSSTWLRRALRMGMAWGAVRDILDSMWCVFSSSEYPTSENKSASDALCSWGTSERLFVPDGRRA